MINLLIRISHHGSIQRKYFADGNLVKRLKSVYDLLNEEDSKKFESLIQEIKSSYITNNFMIKGEKHVLYVTPFGHYFLVYITNQTLNQSQLNIISDIFDRYTKSFDIKLESDIGEKIFFYDNIQKLNNQLINETREKEQLNKRLNKANALLNDRLVKDPLTKLISRYQYRDEIILKLKHDPNKEGIFIFIDIDNFKLINDNFGHSVGDQYLVEFSKRLKQLYNHHLVMRISGDEFGVFVYPVNESHLQTDDLKLQLESIMHPIILEQQSLNLSFSAGIAKYPNDTEAIHLLIDYADFAMYQAKRKNETLHVFNGSEFEKRSETDAE